MESSERALYDSSGIHNVLFVKKLLEFSDDYARSTTKNQFWYLDTNAANITNPADIGVNAGAAARGALSHNEMIPLNSFSFFENLSDKLLPPIFLKFDITLQNDAEMTFQKDGTARHIVVRKLKLWVPSQHFKPAGQKLVNENFLKPISWSYLKETLIMSRAERDASGVWRIMTNTLAIKHVLVFIQLAALNNSLTHNPYLFDTLNIANVNVKLAICQLKYSGELFPNVSYDTADVPRILEDALEFRYRNYDYNTGTQLQNTNFSALSPFVSFDLLGPERRADQ